MSSSTVTKPPSKDVSRPVDDSVVVEEQESSSKASASVYFTHTALSDAVANTLCQAGLNLNVFGAVAGMFSSKSSKSAGADGSTVETREDQSRVQGKYVLGVPKTGLTSSCRSCGRKREGPCSSRRRAAWPTDAGCGAGEKYLTRWEGSGACRYIAKHECHLPVKSILSLCCLFRLGPLGC